jgi:hypothetical protein
MVLPVFQDGYRAIDLFQQQQPRNLMRKRKAGERHDFMSCAFDAIVQARGAANEENDFSGDFG